MLLCKKLNFCLDGWKEVVSIKRGQNVGFRGMSNVKFSVERSINRSKNGNCRFDSFSQVNWIILFMEFRLDIKCFKSCRVWVFVPLSPTKKRFKYFASLKGTVLIADTIGLIGMLVLWILDKPYILAHCGFMSIKELTLKSFGKTQWIDFKHSFNSVWHFLSNLVVSMSVLKNLVDSKFDWHLAVGKKHEKEVDEDSTSAADERKNKILMCNEMKLCRLKRTIDGNLRSKKLTLPGEP